MGHEELLREAFKAGNHVVIGVTSDELAKTLGKKPTFNYRQRVMALRRYLKRNYPQRNFTISKLYDIFGPAILHGDIEALVASRETISRLQLANEMRRKLKLPPLKAITVPMVMAEDGRPISNSRIRNGEIDSEGKLLTGLRRTRRE
jgi:pantetheine-phosphate adenylyltransferase